MTDLFLMALIMLGVGFAFALVRISRLNDEIRELKKEVKTNGNTGEE